MGPGNREGFPLTPEAKMAGFPLSSMSSNSSLVVVRPAVDGITLNPAFSRELSSF